MLPPRYKILLICGWVLAGIFLLEIALRTATPHPISEVSNKREGDPRLVYRMDKTLKDSDARGFRNPESNRTQYDIAAIGDSHTYGFNVASDKSWPSLLARDTEYSVYNLGIGGYGFYQYLALLEDPGITYNKAIVALYPANDFDAKQLCGVVRLPYWQERMATENITQPGCPSYAFAYKKKGPWRKVRGMMQDLSFDSAIVSILWNGWLNEALPVDPERDVVHIGTHPLHIARAEEHAFGTDLDDTDIAATFAAFERLFGAYFAAEPNRNSSTCFVIVPSKELVLARWAQAHPDLVRGDIAVIEAFVQNEIRLTEALKAVLKKFGTPYADAFDDVMTAFSRAQDAGEKFYPEKDGHPFETGYLSYALAARRCVNQLR